MCGHAHQRFKKYIFLVWACMYDVAWCGDKSSQQEGRKLYIKKFLPTHLCSDILMQYTIKDDTHEDYIAQQYCVRVFYTRWDHIMVVIKTRVSGGTWCGEAVISFSSPTCTTTITPPTSQTNHGFTTFSRLSSHTHNPALAFSHFFCPLISFCLMCS